MEYLIGLVSTLGVFFAVMFLVWRFIEYPKLKREFPEVRVSFYFTLGFWKRLLRGTQEVLEFQKKERKERNSKYPYFIRVIPLLLILIFWAIYFD